MLILSRKPGQQITIGPNITLTVTALTGGRVKLGITAPPDVQVLRTDAKKREGK